MEIGLHHSSTGCGISEVHTESRNRVFWTAYAIEITISYNLGRPPSISDEHITTDYPTYSVETSLAIQHIKHRRIQGRIISQVYCGAFAAGHKTAEEQQHLIARLQTELEDWKADANALCSPSDKNPYPQRCVRLTTYFNLHWLTNTATGIDYTTAHHLCSIGRALCAPYLRPHLWNVAFVRLGLTSTMYTTCSRTATCLHPGCWHKACCSQA